MAKVPLVGGLAGAGMVPPIRSMRLMRAAAFDWIGSIFGLPTQYMPISVGPGEWGVQNTDDALYGKSLIEPKASTEWHNRLAARSLLSIAAHRPVRRAADIACPILLVVAE